MINKAKEYKTGLFFRGAKNYYKCDALVNSLIQFLDSKGNIDKFVIDAEYVSCMSASSSRILDFDRVKIDVESGEIDCIVVKNITWVARNIFKVHEALNYFLENNVRFISIEDNYDNLEELRKVAE